MRLFSLLSFTLLFAPQVYGNNTFKTKVARPGEDILNFSDDGRSASIRVLARNEDTGGRFSAAEHYMPAGYKGPGFHQHHGIVQALYVVSGSVVVRLIKNCQAQSVSLTEGSFLSIAPKVQHTFESEHGAKLLTIDAPGNLVPMFEAMAAIDRSQSPEQQLHDLEKIRKKSYDNDFSESDCEL